MKEFWIITGSTPAMEEGLISRCSSLADERNLKTRLFFYDTSSRRQDEVLAELLQRYRESPPEVIIFEHDEFFGNVAPAFAAIIKKGITADCTDFKWDEQYGLLQIRPTYGGRKIAVNRSLSLPAIATVRRGVFGHCDALIKDNRNLETSSLIFAGGLGLGSRENFGRLAELAKRCNAALGASRAAVAAGYTDYSHQIGQTGITVHPELYVAFGISGAIQHLSGMIHANRIIAINSDPKAPIHQYADYSLIEDANEVIALLLDV